MISTAATEPVMPISEPIERSISPAISTTVKPAAMIDTVAACSSTLSRLAGVRKKGETSDSPAEMTSSAM